MALKPKRLTYGEIAQMVDQVLDNFFSRGPEFKSWLERVFLS